jgi:hypothetical protein
MCESTYVEQDLENEGSEDGRAGAEDGAAAFVESTVTLLAEITTIGTVDDDNKLDINVRCMLASWVRYLLTAARQVAPMTKPSKKILVRNDR